MNALPGPDGRPPLIGIVGHAGAYGRWLSNLLGRRMGLAVIGHDPADAGALPLTDVVRRADVLVFSVPIRDTVAVIDACVALGAGTEAGRLWLDLTSIKQAPVAAMLRSRAEVAGLHPMTAPPRLDSLRGRTMAVCRARIDRWAPWLDALLAALQADCVEVTPDVHDRAMALVQGMVHATHMAQGAALRALAPAAGGLDMLHALRSVGYDLDLTVTGRMLAGNPAIYEDIQFGNPHVPAVLDALAEALADLRDQVADGGEPARATVRRRYLGEPAAWIGDAELAARSHGFERMGYLQADLAEPRYLSVFLPEDRPGALREVLAMFEVLGANLSSIHSSRTPAGELHFRMGLDALPVPLTELLAAIEAAGIVRVLDARDDG